MLLQPVAHGVEQAVGNFLVVHRLEEAKEATILVIFCIVDGIQDPGNTSHRLAITPRQPVSDLSKVMEGMFAKPNQLFQVAT